MKVELSALTTKIESLDYLKHIHVEINCQFYRLDNHGELKYFDRIERNIFRKNNAE